MQHMNFDTELINHFARENRKTSNDFSKGGAYDQIHPGKEKLVGNSQSSSTNDNHEALDEMTMQLAKTKAKALVDEVFTGENFSRRNGVSLEPTQFTDALEILKLKRSLFLQRIQLSQTECESLELFLDSRSVDIRGSIDSEKGNIVVLRPAPKVMDSPKHVICSCSSLSSHQHSKGKDRKVKSSYFCLKDIKKRLKRALRNEPPTMKCIDTDKGKPRKSVRKGRENSPSNETAIGNFKLRDDTHFKSQELDIFQEAKKHLSERLKSVNNFTVIENCRASKSLGRILCSPEHDIALPPSLKWNIKHLSVMTECESPLRLSMGTDQKSDDDDPMISDINELRIPEDSSEPISKDSSTYSPQKVGDIEYGEEHQSPISVLEPLFMEDANTPKRSSLGKLQPLRIAFEDCDCMNEDEAIQEYVRAVLQAAGFNWNDHLQSRPSQDEILNVSFSYGDILLQIKTEDDPQLLVDFVNDVLLEIYQHHFGCSVWTSSYIKSSTRSFLLQHHFMKQVVEDVKGAIFPELLHPTLDQLVGKDIDKSSSSWLDIRVDVEDLVSTIAEELLEESIYAISVMLSTL